MKSKFYFLTATFVLFLVIHTKAQTNSWVAAFSKSYEAEARKEMEQAIKPLLDVYENTSYEMNLRLGWLYYKQGDYKKSIEFYSQAKSLKPLAIEPLAGLIYPYAGLNNTQMLLDLYNQILNIDPLDINSNYQLGFIQYNNNAKEKAKNYFEKIIQLYPSGYEPFLFEAYTKITNPDDIKKRNVDVFKNSFEYEYAQNYKQAIEVLKPIYDKNYYDVNMRLGWLNYLSKQYVESCNYYTIAIGLKPNSFEPRYGFVFPAIALGNNESAQTQYKKMLELTPKNTYANYGYGLGLYNKSDFENALKSFQSIVDLYPFNYDGLLMLGWTHLKLNHKEEAKNYFTKVLLYSPQDKSAKEGLTLLNK
jgi:tetratricopeptide (TPR) repeat protein